MPLSVWAGRQDSGTDMSARFLNFSAITAIQFLTIKCCYGVLFFFRDEDIYLKEMSACIIIYSKICMNPFS